MCSKYSFSLFILCCYSIEKMNAAICNQTDESLEHHATQSKSDRNSEEPYSFTHKWEIKLKAGNEQTSQTNKQKLTDTHNSVVVTGGNGSGGDSKR